MSRFSMIGPLVLTISGGVLYHLTAKSIPKELNPWLVLIAAYASALAASLAAYIWLPAASATPHSARVWHPAVLALGLAAFLIELGYVLAYRAALPLTTTSVITSGMVAALLVPVGLGIFGERLSFANGLGLVLCLTGLALLRR
jgi:drug/metabolite transporter (DMT)-like permease